MSEVFSTIKSIGIVPVIKLENPKDSLKLGKALVEGGLLAAEVTFRTKSAAESIALLKREFPALTTGAGTVLTIEQAEAAIAAGASYIVTPGFNPRIVDFCLSKGMPVMPGINSPSQVEQGLERGLKLLKFFPAEVSGGLKMLKALHGPYADVSFVPTGGVDASNVESYLQLPYVAAIGGSWMVKEDLIASGQYGRITALCAEAVALVRRVRGPKLA
ncbi:MAG: bifunctional 4-hydroxy-2-oxoglutarate aldolase/2-dehydro-3-deoxy-phosphogluconate aldolase [Sphaerochaetaceae bacterium]|jgi:2-dehydro-3-deoxyphosphogluconate aldolase/(4S)-4-hydroxy-2-oxoglutarate aldolase|nr:bifunctional 4-hydroxy-2-oxoglutarate aldolase/2-dehydro-3-deoxy-phosphogluconate aldolase [Sphaerochaetaceae bacterium]